MKYKYRSTCRFPILLVINNEIAEVRPNQVIDSDQQFDHMYLKPIVDKENKPTRKRRKTNGSDNSTSGNDIRE
jgi:hypothetical protein